MPFQAFFFTLPYLPDPWSWSSEVCQRSFCSLLAELLTAPYASLQLFGGLLLEVRTLDKEDTRFYLAFGSFLGGRLAKERQASELCFAPPV